MSDALAGGLSKGEMRWRLRSGRWQRPMPGVLLTHSGPVTRAQLLWCALAWAGPQAALAGLTAASLDGLRGFDTPTVSVTVPAGRQLTPRPGVIVHRSRQVGPADVHPTRAPRRTRLPRSIMDAATWAARDEDARAILAAAVQQRLVTVDHLCATVERRRPAHRRQLIVAMLADIGDGAASVAEAAFLQIERRYGLPAGRRQHRVDTGGRRRYLDVWYEQWRVWVEIDGGAHREVRSWWADLARQNRGVLEDRTVLRFPTWMLRERPAEVAGQVAAALRMRGWDGR